MTPLVPDDSPAARGYAAYWMALTVRTPPPKPFFNLSERARARWTNAANAAIDCAGNCYAAAEAAFLGYWVTDGDGGPAMPFSWNNTGQTARVCWLAFAEAVRTKQHTAR